MKRKIDLLILVLLSAMLSGGALLAQEHQHEQGKQESQTHV
jgi:hypothetical protein